MKNVRSLKNIISVAALSLGLSSAAVASTAADEPAQAAGLLGHSYATLSVSAHDLHNSPVDATAVQLEYNRPLTSSIDSFFVYEGMRSERFTGNGRLASQSVEIGGRYHVLYAGVRPFIDVSAGWLWAKAPFGFREDSFAWSGGAGFEVQVTPALSVAPYARYTDVDDLGDGWNYGIKSNYWLNDRAGILAVIDRDEDQNMEYRLGVNVRF